MANNVKQDVELDLTNSEGKRAVLVLSTAKSGRLIKCSCTVFWSDGQFRSTALFGDYHKNLATTDKRATQKTIDTQHALVFDQAGINVQVQAVKDFYAAKAAKESI